MIKRTKKYKITFFQACSVMLFIFLTGFLAHASSNKPITISKFKSCDLNGAWWDTHGQWDLVHQGMKLVGLDWNQPSSPCPGRFPLSGTVNVMQVIFHTTNPNPSSTCSDWFDYRGVLSEECTTITGTWINSLGRSGTFKLTRDSNPYLRIITPAKNHPPFIIDVGEMMPMIPLVVEIKRIEKDPSSQTEFYWTNDIRHKITRRQTTTAHWTDVVIGKNYKPRFTDFLTNGPRGGLFKLTVEADVNKHHLIDSKTYKIHGTNPGQQKIDAEFAAQSDDIPLQVIKGIACAESHYRQFASIREGGTGIPVIGSQTSSGHKAVGIMQVLNPLPTSRAVWSWRQNIQEGLYVLSEKVTVAKKVHISERKKLNSKRKEAGLPACPIGVPMALNDEQLVRESIRRYNSGREYQWEPWDAAYCEDGQWMIDPINIGKHGDPNYVDKVLNCNIELYD
jgi:hypothetical protein